MSDPAVADLIRRVSNWGRWGPDDELGTVNHITAAQRAEAACLVRSGEVFSLAVDFEPDTPQVKASYRLNPQRSMVATGSDVKTGRQAAFGIPGHGFSDDMVVMSLQATTQWDSLAHVFHDYRMYNGRDCELVGAKGAAANSIAVLRDRVVTRGVLADVAGHLGVDSLEPDHHITVEELEATLASQRVEIGTGDALLVRTGHLGRVRREGDWERFVQHDEPGLGWDSLPWLHDREIAAVALGISHRAAHEDAAVGINSPIARVEIDEVKPGHAEQHEHRAELGAQVADHPEAPCGDRRLAPHFPGRHGLPGDLPDAIFQRVALDRAVDREVTERRRVDGRGTLESEVHGHILT